MKNPLCRSAAVGRLLATLYLFIVLLPGTTSDSSRPSCEGLSENSPKKDFIRCWDYRMFLQAYTNKTYPIADFSDFSQEEFEDAMTPKKQDETEGKMTGVERAFSGNFQAKSSQISCIAIGFYVKDINTPQSFVLIDNWNLTSVTIKTPTNSSINSRITMKFTIRNNKMLSPESITHLNKIEYLSNDSYIQNEGECDLNQTGLNSLEDLEYCKYTLNNLIINEDTDIETIPAIVLKELRGCIVMKKTNLENLNVLKSIDVIFCPDKHEIVDNEKLCLHPEEIFNWRNKLNATLVYKNNNNCSGECTPEYFLQKEDPTCVIITDTLKVSDMPEDANLTYFKNVQEIRGRLVMRNNLITDLSPAVLFPKLKLVDGTYDNTGPAIEVMYNNKLVNFKLDDHIKVKFKTHEALHLQENGNFTLSKKEKEELKEKLGNDAIAADTEVVQEKIHSNVGNSTSRKSKKEEIEEESDVIGITIGAGIGAIVALILLLLAGYCVFVATRVVKKRKEMLSVQRIYDSATMTNLNIPAIKLVVYPYDVTNAWINSAAEILKENVERIKEHEKDRRKRKATESHLFLQKNSRPVNPMFSRFDAEHQNFTEEYIGVCESFYNPVSKQKEKKCLKGCIFGPNDHASPVCVKECVCTDIGIKVNSLYAYGIRMQQVPVAKWSKQELEKNHFCTFKLMDPPITFEENYLGTAEWMAKEPSSYIKDEKSFQEKKKQKLFSWIDGKVLKKVVVKKDKDQVTQTEDNHGCIQRYSITLYTYSSKDNKLDDIRKFSITPKPPNVCKAFWKGLNPCRYFSCRGKKESQSIENHDEFVDNMINAHMNCPLGKWVTNYNVDDIVKLCNLLAEETNKAYVEQKKVNTRIIGDIRGKFDDLRKMLCLPSANAPDAHPLVKTPHIFLGNYAGPYGQSMEVICLLFALKYRYKNQYTLLRGALDWRKMGDVSGLKSEIYTRFPGRGGEVWEAVNKVFDRFPLVCKLGENILCTHAGIAPRMKEIEGYPMPITDLVPDTLPFNLMFAQPNWTVKRFFDNVDQKAGYYFGYEAMKTVLESFNCRALYCSKMLESGYGVIGISYRLFSVCGHQASEDHHIAQAEYDVEGKLNMQVLHMPVQEAVEYNDEQPHVLTEEEKVKTNSQMFEVAESKMDNPKSTLSVVKTQCDSIANAPVTQNEQ